MARVLILVVSDSASQGEQTDKSGESIRHWCGRRGDTVVAKVQVADDTSQISPVLIEWCDSGQVDLILTTGGTGLAPRDVTPEATLAVIDREAQGIAEYIRANSFVRFPMAALSRSVAGTRGKTLIINLPGSLTGTQDGLATILGIIDHALDILTGNVSRHETPFGTPVIQ